MKYDTKLTVKVTEAQAEKLKKIAAARQTSQGTIIRQFIEKAKL